MIFENATFSAGALQKREVWDSVALTYTVFNGQGSQISQRALTPFEQAEIAARVVATTAETNGGTLRTKAQAALTTNATFLAIATPTAAQNAAQAKALTRQVNGLIRLLLGALSDVSDT